MKLMLQQGDGAGRQLAAEQLHWLDIERGQKQSRIGYKAPSGGGVG